MKYLAVSKLSLLSVIHIYFSFFGRCTDTTVNRSMKRFISQSVLEASVGGLLSIRLREGFTIKSVTFSKSGSMIDLVLVMPWKPEINLEYRICAVWPPTENTQITAEVHVEAPYEFLYDWIYMNSQKVSYGKHRLATLRQFKNTVRKRHLLCFG